MVESINRDHLINFLQSRLLTVKKIDNMEDFDNHKSMGTCLSLLKASARYEISSDEEFLNKWGEENNSALPDDNTFWITFSDIEKYSLPEKDLSFFFFEYQNLLQSAA